MSGQKRIATERLILRPFRLSDAGEVQHLAGAFEVADTTLNIPHPYEDGMAEEWIRSHKEKYANKQEIIFAIEREADSQLLGAVGLSIHPKHNNAEMGYWIGKPFWHKGYATEAAKVMLRYGFEQLKMERIYAHCFLRNPASGRVLQKLGMRHEGTLRQHIKKWNKLEDVQVYGILRTEFFKKNPNSLKV